MLVVEADAITRGDPCGAAHVHPTLWCDCHRVRGRPLVNLFGEGGAGHARALLRLQSCSGFGSSKPFGSAISNRGSRFGIHGGAQASHGSLLFRSTVIVCVPCQGALLSLVETQAGKLSLQPEALGADQEATNGLKHPEKRPRKGDSGPCGPQRE
jgi:hypothetical protein